MNNDKRESFFINYYMSKRVMRKTHDPETLHQIYASKYANWIVPFLKQHGIVNAPSLLCCNTLAQLPDFFTLQARLNEQQTQAESSKKRLHLFTF